MIISQAYKDSIKLRFDLSNDSKVECIQNINSGIISFTDFDDSWFKQLSLKEILYYLKKSHTEYLTVWIPELELMSKKIIIDLGVNDLTLTLQSFLVNYSNEMSNHINFEEKVLYNFVEKLLTGSYNEKEKVFVLNHFLETHNHNVANDLTTLKRVLQNKDAKILNHKNAVKLFDLMTAIQNDLQIHAVVEDDILMDKIHEYIEQYL